MTAEHDDGDVSARPEPPAGPLSGSGAAGGRPRPISPERSKWEARNAVDSTEDPRYGMDGGSPSRVASPPAPWHAFGTATDVADLPGGPPPVDPVLLSPPNGIP